MPTPESLLCPEDEALYESALSAVLTTRRASVSTLQRRLRIGYNQAFRLMAALESRGVVGPEDGISPRAILMKAKSSGS